MPSLGLRIAGVLSVLAMLEVLTRWLKNGHFWGVVVGLGMMTSSLLLIPCIFVSKTRAGWLKKVKGVD